MAKAVQRLSARTVQSLKTPGRHADGAGLYLVVDKSGAKRWVFLYRSVGKLREMGLGGLNAVSLSQARQLAQEARSQVAAGLDPIAEKAKARADAVPIPTFGAFADTFLTDIEQGFRNEKHRKQWRMTLTRYAAPIAHVPVDEVSTDQVLSILSPIWLTRHETASRLRGRIERVLDAAKARGLRSGENPARWRGHLSLLLPAKAKLQRGHHAALPYPEAPDFFARLRENTSVSALGLQFLILTAARTGEVRLATWDEIDLNAGIWSISAGRMKAGREHRVPLSQAACDVLDKVRDHGMGPFIFPGSKRNRPLSEMAFAMLLRRLGREDITVHGFRSTFRDWAAEQTNTPREIAEAALAHVVGDATERAYRRGDALEKRRELMSDWAESLLSA